MGLSLTRAGDYATRAMIYIACLPDGTVVLRSEIADAQAIPSTFTAKILRRLVQARLLDSSRGVNGGFSLARAASEITLLDVVVAIEGPLALTSCSSGDDDCGMAHDCPAAVVWPTVQQALSEALSRVTLEDLASASRRNGRVFRVGDITVDEPAPLALTACN